jgi:hypothetical protein
MANIVKIKNSNVVGRVPSSLETGELAINISDGKLFFKNANNQIDSFNSNAVVHQNFAEATYFPQANNTINSTNIDSYQKINTGEFKFTFTNNFSSNTYNTEINIQSFENFGEPPNFGIISEKEIDYVIVKTGRTNINDINIIDRFDISQFKIKLFE